MDEKEELNAFLESRIREVEESLQNLNGEKYKKIKGIRKMQNRLDSELKFFKSFKNGAKNLERKYLETCNVIHLKSIIAHIDLLENVTAILHTFAIRDTQDDYDDNEQPEMIKHTVDIVAQNGDQWVKVISRSPRGILMDWMTGCQRNVFEQGRDYLTMSRRFKNNFAAPEVHFIFSAGVPDKVAEKLQRKGIVVNGERIDSDTLAKIPPDYLEMLEEDSDDEEAEDNWCEENGRSTATKFEKRQKEAVVNLDVSAVFVLITNMTHDNGTEHKFASSVLELQAKRERKNRARVELLKLIENKKWIMCRTAFESVNNIMKTVSGEQEMKRWIELIEKIEIVDDQITERARKLKESNGRTDQVNRNFIIFGSGDYYQATTVTSNKHFLSSAFNQGIPFAAIIHEPRALSEQKERPMNWCKLEQP